MTGVAVPSLWELNGEALKPWRPFGGVAMLPFIISAPHVVMGRAPHVVVTHGVRNPHARVYLRHGDNSYGHLAQRFCSADLLRFSSQIRE